jgi:hypothetical protein
MSERLAGSAGKARRRNLYDLELSRRSFVRGAGASVVALGVGMPVAAHHEHAAAAEVGASVVALTCDFAVPGGNNGLALVKSGTFDVTSAFPVIMFDQRRTMGDD